MRHLTYRPLIARFADLDRSMTLLATELLRYSTAIRSKPQNPGQDSQPHWKVVMHAHAARNFLAFEASNRIECAVAPGGI